MLHHCGLYTPVLRPVDHPSLIKKHCHLTVVACFCPTHLYFQSRAKKELTCLLALAFTFNSIAAFMGLNGILEIERVNEMNSE